MKRVLAFLLCAVIVFGFLTPLVSIEAEAVSNIVINGVDIGYAAGDYFTKNGKSCATSAFSNGTCHGHDICVTNTDSRCNCLRYWPSKANCQVDLGGTQCFGFTRFCQWKLYGYHDGNASSKFSDISGRIVSSSCTASTLKSKLLGCAPATHIRTSDGHSMAVVTTTADSIQIVSCNTKVNGVKVCKIYAKSYTWSEFATYLSGRDGILYAKAAASVTNTYGSTNPDDYDYPTRSLTYTSPTMKGRDVAWVQAVLYRLGYSIEIDGSYGQGSVSAIKQFQTKYGLAVDGNCGPATRAKLLEVWNAKKHTTHTYSNACDMTCNVCGATRTVTDHKWSNKYCGSGECTVCGLYRMTFHSYMEATCTAPKTCKECGYISGNKLAHSYSNTWDASCNSCGASRTVSLTNTAPTSFKASLVGNDDVKLTWKAGKGATHYYVYYRRAGKTDWKRADITTALNYTIKNLTDNAKYEFKVVSYLKDSSGTYKGGSTSVLSYSTTRNLSATKKVTLKLYGYDDVKISWSKVSNAAGYKVYYKRSTAKSYSYIGFTTGTSIKKANLSDGVKYTFKVVPCTKVNGSYFEDDSTKTASVTTLKKVSTPKATKSTSTKVKVSWTDISGESGYQIAKTSDKAGKKIVSTTTTTGKSKVITAKKGVTYYYKVRAYKTVDGKKIYAPWSAVKSYKLK